MKRHFAIVRILALPLLVLGLGPGAEDVHSLGDDLVDLASPRNLGGGSSEFVYHLQDPAVPGYFRPVRRLETDDSIIVRDLAAGRFDGFWEARLRPWDIAAASLLGAAMPPSLLATSSILLRSDGLTVELS